MGFLVIIMGVPKRETYWVVWRSSARLEAAVRGDKCHDDGAESDSGGPAGPDRAGPAAEKPWRHLVGVGARRSSLAIGISITYYYCYWDKMIRLTFCSSTLSLLTLTGKKMERDELPES